MTFVDIATAARIEQAEARALAGIPAATTHELAEGIAIFVRPGSPFNKLLGGGITAPFAHAGLVAAERLFRDCGERLRVELCSLAVPATYEQLANRDYRFIAVEHVLVRALDDRPAPPSPFAIERASAADFRAAFLAAAIHEDGTGVVADAFTEATTAAAIDDARAAPGFLDYVACDAGTPVGAATMHVSGEIAVLMGSGTVPAHRGRGVQRALLERRLHDAYAAGARLAVVTTGTGTRSQANVMKAGFAVAYARSILLAGARADEA